MTNPSLAPGERPRLIQRLCLMLLISAAAFGTARAQSFSLPIPRNVGFNPNTAAVGDFNGDGKPDAAVGNAQASSVTIALGNGDGTFASSIEYNTDLQPEGVAVGDFNKDGKLDVAVANFRGGPLNNGNISVLFGNGDGTAQPAVNYNAEINPIRLVAADLNSDGNLDLVTASFSSDKATVLLGNANGTFNAAVGYAVGTHPQDVAVADFNNDGKLDLATPNYDGASLSVLLGNGDGTFQAATNIPLTGSLFRPFNLTAGDLNGDGKQDLVFASPNGAAVGVLLGNGNGTFQTAVAYATTTGEPVNAKFGDFNGDGKLDVAVVNAGFPGSVGVLRGNGDGTLQAVANFPTQNNPWGLVVTDFNLDGKPDLITTNNGIGRINVLLNSPSARGASFNATIATQLNGVLVATFIDYDTTKTAADFAAAINWGDGTATSAGAVAANGGGFDVTGTHTYAATGAYTVTVQIADTSENFASASGTATVVKKDQTITFDALAGKTLGDSDFPVSATASSGLAVSFDASGNCVMADASTVRLTGAGTCTVTASQAGDANFNAAPNVSRSFSIAKANQLITFNAIPDKIYGAADFRVFAQTSSALVPTFTTSGQCALVSGNTFHITGAGSCTITASQAGNANFNPAPDVSRSFQIAKAATATALSSSSNPSGAGQTVTFTATVTSAAGTPTGSVQFKSDGSNLGSPVALDAGGVATLDTSSLTAGTHAITADYGGDANFAASTGTLSGGQAVAAGGVIEFKSNFAVGERAGSVIVTATRSGSTALAVSVDYATEDGSTPSVFVPCSAVTGMALDRCDYTKAVGTLHFAAGESEKSFVVLVSDDTYVEGEERADLRLSNPTGGAALGPRAVTNLIIGDDSPESIGNPLDDDASFVRQHYHDFLNREPDESGITFWTSQITSCGANQQCREVRRINVSAAFFLSIEFQETGYLVYRTYKTAFGDATSPGVAGTVPIIRLDEFLPDTQRIGLGLVVGQGAWQAQLEANKVAYFEEFVSRPRFANGAPTTMTPAQFVDALFANAGVTPTAAERQAAIGEFGNASNTADTAARARVLRRVAEHPALNQLEKNRAFVLMEYFGYLRRNPNDAPEPTLNYAGWRFWLDKLNSFNGDFIKAEMVKAFITSDEYRHRFGQ